MKGGPYIGDRAVRDIVKGPAGPTQVHAQPGESPDFVDPGTEALAARDYKRINRHTRSGESESLASRIAHELMRDGDPADDLENAKWFVFEAVEAHTKEQVRLALGAAADCFESWQREECARACDPDQRSRALVRSGALSEVIWELRRAEKNGNFDLAKCPVCDHFNSRDQETPSHKCPWAPAIYTATGPSMAVYRGRDPRLMAEDYRCIQNPKRWPHSAWLPLKRRPAKIGPPSDEFGELRARERAIASPFVVHPSRSPVPTIAESLVYPDIEAMFADGWIVDQ